MILIADSIKVSIGNYSYENIRVFDESLPEYRILCRFFMHSVKSEGHVSIRGNGDFTFFKIIVDIDNPLNLKNAWISDFILYYKDNYTVGENILRKYL